MGQSFQDCLLGKTLATKPEDLSSVPGTHVVERELTPCKLSSDFHIDAVAHVHLPSLKK